jgi:hypothetical protein
VQHFAQAGELLIQILNKPLRLVQLLGVPGGEFDALDLLLRGLVVIAAEALSVTQLAFGKGLHGDSYPFPPGGLSQAPCTRRASSAQRVDWQSENTGARNLRANPFK